MFPLYDEIPLEEAASYFIKIKKANWARTPHLLQKAREKVAEEVEVTEDVPPPNPDLMPVNYLEAEQLAQEAQQANEANFYRQKLQDAATQMQLLQSQQMDMQQQLDQVSQQAQQANMSIQVANQQASAAQDEATRQAQLAANMRMGMQTMRQQLMDLASQDPEAFSAPQQPMGPETGMESPEPPPQEGPAEQAEGAPLPEENMQGEGAPMPTYEQQAAGAEPTAEMKMGSALTNPLPWAALGGALGGAGAYLQGQKGPEGYQEQIQQAEQATEGGGFSQAVRLARLKAQSEMAGVMQKHPVKSTLMGAASGALLGASAGPGVVRELGRTKNLMGRLLGPSGS